MRTVASSSSDSTRACGPGARHGAVPRQRNGALSDKGHGALADEGLLAGAVLGAGLPTDAEVHLRAAARLYHHDELAERPGTSAVETLVAATVRVPAP